MGSVTTHEIVRSNWTFFFTGFSRMHAGWIVTVERFDDLGVQTVASDMAFEGIAEVGGAITIMAASAPARHIAHTVREPLHVFLDQGDVDHGFGEMLEIVSSGGVKTLLRFRAPIAPDHRNGV